MKPTSRPKLANNLVVLPPGSIWLGLSRLAWWRLTQPHRHGSVSPPHWHGATCPQEMPADGEHKCPGAGAAMSTSRQVPGLNPHHLQEQWPRSRTAGGSPGAPGERCGWGATACLLSGGCQLFQQCTSRVRRKGPAWWRKLAGTAFEVLVHCYR